MQCQRVLEEKAADPEAKPDEDGPPSSDGAEERSTDDESLSEDDAPQKPHGAIYGGYFERQRAGLCAIHAVSLGPLGYRIHAGGGARRTG